MAKSLSRATNHNRTCVFHILLITYMTCYVDVVGFAEDELVRVGAGVAFGVAPTVIVAVPLLS